jgi:uncharacterized protein with ATP-grasp and redox domains
MELLSIIGHVKTHLYIGDNAGEIVFDRILIEELRKIKEFEIHFVSETSRSLMTLLWKMLWPQVWKSG